jgi:type I restriction enzyme S subunit
MAQEFTPRAELYQFLDTLSEEARITGDQVRSYGEVSKGYTSFQNNDVLIAKITPCFENGKGALATDLENGIGFGSTEFHVLRAKPAVEPEFLYYLTLSHPFRGRGKLNMQGSAGQKRVPTDFLRSYHFLCPPHAEQRKIADILGTWDEAIALTEQLIGAKQRRKKALMQQLLTGKRRFKEFEGQPWQRVRIGDLARFINGRAFKPSDWEESGLPIIRIQNLNGSPEFNYYNGAVDDRYYIEDGDLLFSWSGSRGTSFGPHIWHGDRGILNQHIFRVENKDLINRAFLFFALSLITVLIEQRAHGSAGIVHITKSELEKIRLEMPISVAEQQRIAEVLSACEDEIKLLARKLDALRRQKKGLMQQLLTGRVRVKVE